MKKRLFAGALALLMIIGLLPVSSILKKPIEAKADSARVFLPPTSAPKEDVLTENGEISETGYYKILYNSGMKVEQNELTFIDSSKKELTLSNRFYVNGKASLSSGKYKNAISFTTKKKCNVKVYWSPKASCNMQITTIGTNGKANVVVKSSTENTTENGAAKYSEFSIDATDSDTTYYIGGTSNYYIYKIEVAEGGDSTDDNTTKYTVKVSDGTNTSTNYYEEGKSVTIEADKDKKDNFAYWVNSNGRIVSRVSSYTFNVYFSDTYTAVYKDTTTKQVVFLTVYNQEYMTKTYDESFTMPSVPARFGYTSGAWDKTAEQIAEEIKSSNIVQVKATNYVSDASQTYTVKVRGTEDNEYYNGKQVEANKIITVKATKSGFKYWYDENLDQIVSYNEEYSFYVNRNINIQEKLDTKDPEGIITLVSVNTNADNNREIIYEFTVPDGCEIKFAGIVADTEKAKVNDKDATYKGGRGSSSTTFKYTLTIDSSMIGSLYVKPILKYTDADGKMHVNDTTEAKLASEIELASKIN